MVKCGTTNLTELGSGKQPLGCRVLLHVEGQESYHYDEATLLSEAVAAESIRCDRDVIFASGDGAAATSVAFL